MHATPENAFAATVAVDLAKDVFELAFADTDGRLVERRCLLRPAFAQAFDNSGRHFASYFGPGLIGSLLRNSQAARSVTAQKRVRRAAAAAK